MSTHCFEPLVEDALLLCVGESIDVAVRLHGKPGMDVARGLEIALRTVARSPDALRQCCAGE